MSTLKPIIITRPEEMTDDSTLDDEYRIQYWDALPPETRRLIALHYQDQWEAVPSYVEQNARQFALEVH